MINITQFQLFLQSVFFLLFFRKHFALHLTHPTASQTRQQLKLQTKTPRFTFTSISLSSLPVKLEVITSKSIPEEKLKRPETVNFLKFLMFYFM